MCKAIQNLFILLLLLGSPAAWANLCEGMLLSPGARVAIRAWRATPHAGVETPLYLKEQPELKNTLQWVSSQFATYQQLLSEKLGNSNTDRVDFNSKMIEVRETSKQVLRLTSVSKITIKDLIGVIFRYRNALELYDNFLVSGGQVQARNELLRTYDPSHRMDRDLYESAWIEKYPFGLLVPTEKSLSIEDFNELSPYPVVFIGLGSTLKSGETLAEWRGIDFFDASRSSRARFIAHDLTHALGKLESIRLEMTKKPFPVVIERRVEFYARYKQLRAKVTDPMIRLALDFHWFNFTHEFETGVNCWEYSKRGLRKYIAEVWFYCPYVKARLFDLHFIRLKDPNNFGFDPRFHQIHEAHSSEALRLLEEFAK